MNTKPLFVSLSYLINSLPFLFPICFIDILFCCSLFLLYPSLSSPQVWLTNTLWQEDYFLHAIISVQCLSGSCFYQVSVLPWPWWGIKDAAQSMFLTIDLFHSMVCGPSVSPTFLYSISCTVWCVLLLSWKSALVYFFTLAVLHNGSLFICHSGTGLFYISFWCSLMFWIRWGHGRSLRYVRYWAGTHPLWPEIKPKTRLWKQCCCKALSLPAFSR